MRRITPLLACLLVLAACSTDASRSDGSESTVGTTAVTAPVDTGSPTTDASAATDAGTTVPLGDRPFDVFVPSSYTEGSPMPLLLLLHGYGATGDIQETYVGMQALAEERGFLYVHPDGTTNLLGDQFWNATDACCQRLQDDVDDVGYLMAIVDDVSARYSVDPDRVWFAGHSNGGFMSHRLACDHADRIAAIASLAGATWADPSKCSPSEPVSVLQIHGTDDATIAYAGGDIFNVAYPGARQTVDTWAQKDGCGAMAPSEVTLDLDSNLEGAESTVLAAEGCPAGIGVELWTIAGGGHIPALSPTFASLVVDWLYAHPKP